MSGIRDPFVRSTELEAIIRRWVQTYGTDAAPAVADLFSASAAATYIGSAEDEVWNGDALRTVFAGYAKEIPRFSPDIARVEAYEAGSVGWGYWTGTVNLHDTGLSALVRTTFVFSLEGAVWRIVHMHNSTPVSNIESMGYETQAFEDLLQAAEAARAPLPAAGIASVMFTDIADSSTLAEAMGDSAWSAILHRHLDLVGGIIADHDGTLVKSLGDGTLSTFNSARAAMLAAQAVQQALGAELEEPKLSARVGIHTGDVIASEGDFFGTVVNKAARVAGMARPGEIRVSDATRAMVGRAAGFVFTDPVEAPLKGLEGTHLLHLLEWLE